MIAVRIGTKTYFYFAKFAILHNQCQALRIRFLTGNEIKKRLQFVQNVGISDKTVRR